MSKHRTLLAGLLGLFGGLPKGGGDDDVQRPTVDDVWKQATPKKEKIKIRNIGQRANMKARLKKHRWRIARDSRKKNYAVNGTRG